MLSKKFLTPCDCGMLAVYPLSHIHTPITSIHLPPIKLLHHPYIDHPRCTRPHSVATHARGLRGGISCGDVSEGFGGGWGWPYPSVLVCQGGGGREREGKRTRPSLNACRAVVSIGYGFGVLRRPCSSQITMGGHVVLQGVPCSASMGGPPWLAAPFSFPFPLANTYEGGSPPPSKTRRLIFLTVISL